MKYAMILLDGAADRPLKALDGQTPLQAADTPALDRLSAAGRVGMVQTVPEALFPETASAALAIMGIDPATCYTGRGPLEALAHKLALEPRDRVYRCNFVTVADGDLADYSAGGIATAEARLLVEALNAEPHGEGVEFIAGVSYRALLVLRDVGTLDIATTPPHDIYNLAIEPYVPRGKDARRLIDLMERSAETLAAHDVNRVRIDMGENPATGIWPYGGGGAIHLPALDSATARQTAIVGASDLWRGVAAGLGIDFIDVPEAAATGEAGIAALGRVAVDALSGHDMVIVHAEAPDEASHRGQVSQKVRAIERIDAEVAAPLARALEGQPHRLIALAGHAASCDTQGNLPDAVPFVIEGEEIQHIADLPFHERGARKSDLKIDDGHLLMEFFLRV